MFILKNYVSISEDSFELKYFNIKSNLLNLESDVAFHVLFKSKGHIFLETYNLQFSYKNFLLIEKQRRIKKYIKRSITAYDGFETTIKIEDKLLDENLLNEIDNDLQNNGRIELEMKGKVYIQYGLVLSSFPKFFYFSKFVKLNMTR